MDKRKLGGFDKSTPKNKAEHETKESLHIFLFYLSMLVFCLSCLYGFGQAVVYFLELIF